MSFLNAALNKKTKQKKQLMKHAATGVFPALLFCLFYGLDVLLVIKISGKSEITLFPCCEDRNISVRRQQIKTGVNIALKHLKYIKKQMYHRMYKIIKENKSNCHTYLNNFHSILQHIPLH